MSPVSASLTSGVAGYAGSRTTLRGTQAGLQSSLSAAQSRLAAAQAQASSGRRLSTPSQDVIGTDRALEVRHAIAAEDRYARASSDAKGWLDTTDGALQNGVATMQRVKELVVRAGSGSLSATDRGAIATELDELRQSLLSTANTTYLGRPVFAGTSAASTAFTVGADGSATATGTGTGTVQRELARGVQVRVDTAGADAFGDGAGSVFDLVRDVAAEVRNGTTTTGRTGDVDAALTRMTTAAAGVGARTNHVTSLATSGSSRSLELTSAKADVEEVDLAKAFMDLSTQQTAYQAALSAASKVSTPTLVDFLR